VTRTTSFRMASTLSFAMSDNYRFLGQGVLFFLLVILGRFLYQGYRIRRMFYLMKQRGIVSHYPSTLIMCLLGWSVSALWPNEEELSDTA
jgi:hypothetical protein